MSSKRWHIGEVTEELECKKQSIKIFIFKLHYTAQDKGSRLNLVMKGRRGSTVSFCNLTEFVRG